MVRGLATLFEDARQTARSMRSGRGTLVSAVMTMAAGVTAATLMFGLVSTVLLRPLPFGDPDRLVLVWAHLPQLPLGFEAYPIHGRQFTALREGSTDRFSSLDAFKAELFNLATPDGRVERIDGLVTTAGLFDTLAVHPAAGRFFGSGEDAPGAGRVAVIGYGLWVRAFGAAPQAVGSLVRLNNETFTIVGVAPRGFDFPRGGEMPGNFQFPARTELWVAARPPESGPAEHAVVGRMKPGVSVPQAQAALDAVTQAMEARTPSARGWFGTQAVPMARQTVSTSARTAVALLFAAAMILVVIGCANAAQLLVVRGLRRRTELVIRVALGAGRARLVREALFESLALSSIAAGGALALAIIGVRLIQTLGPSRFPRLAELTVDWRVVLFAALSAVTVAAATSLWPALLVTRTSAEALVRTTPRGGVGRGRAVRQAVLAAQVALSMVLLVASGLLIRSLMQRVAVDPGFRSDGVLTFEITLPPASYPEVSRGPVPAIRPRVVSAIDGVLAKLRANPQVVAAGIGKPLPLSGAQEVTVFVPEGVPLPAADRRPMTEYIIASDGLFEAIGARLVSGRLLTPADREASQPVVVVTRAFGRISWNTEDVVGRRVKLGGSAASPGPWMTVVGVVDDMKRYDLGEKPLPTMFVPYTQGPYASLATVPFVVKVAAGDPTVLTNAIREAVRAVDAQVPVAAVQPMADIVARVTEDARFAVLLMTLFAVTALGLTLAGLYGTVAFMVTLRTPELAIRLALGATGGGVTRLAIVDGTRPVLAGLVAGLVAAWASMQSLQALLFGVATHDPWTFAIVTVLVSLVSIVACGAPALRAARIDPMTALRLG